MAGYRSGKGSLWKPYGRDVLLPHFGHNGAKANGGGRNIRGIFGLRLVAFNLHRGEGTSGP